MADADLVKLYSQRILALAAEAPHSERLPAPDASATERSPLCGSTVTVDVAVVDGKLAALGMDVKACALGQASAALLGRHGLGKSRTELASARDALRARLRGEAATAAAPTDIRDAFEVLTPAVDYKNRHASILLAWVAVVEAMATAERARAAG